jgi:hypothetical protein
MLTIIKYRDLLLKSKVGLLENKEELIKYFRQEMTRSCSFSSVSVGKQKSRSLRDYELVELLKYLNRVEYKNDVESIRVPAFYPLKPADFEITVSGGVDNEQKRITLSEYDANVNKIRFSLLLNELKEKWIDSNFELSASELMATINEQTISKYVVSKKLKQANK